MVQRAGGQGFISKIPKNQLETKAISEMKKCEIKHGKVFEIKVNRISFP